MTQSVSEAIGHVAGLLAAAGKLRKGNGSPYVCHVASVVQIVASYGGDENSQLAAVYHDCPEDLGMPFSTVASLTNIDVGRIVMALTEDKKLPWAERKAATARTAASCDKDTGIVLIADRIDNLAAMVRESPRPYECAAFDAYWRRFNAGPQRQYGVYNDLCRSLLGNENLMTARTRFGAQTREAINELLALLRHFGLLIA